MHACIHVLAVWQGVRRTVSGIVGQWFQLRPFSARILGSDLMLDVGLVPIKKDGVIGKRAVVLVLVVVLVVVVGGVKLGVFLRKLLERKRA